jgi:hypothetical protein
MRRSEMFPSSAIAIPRKSIANAMGCPWKFPPEITFPLSAKMSGLSVAELISINSFSFT